MRSLMLMLVAAVMGTSTLSACSNTVATNGGQTIKVVAAESFWGSIARQVGGNRVQVIDVISNPNTDPHDYDATAADSRSMAQAQVAVINGVGYDPWARKLISANPMDERQVVDVGQLTKHLAGDNPHRWYAPNDVRSVASALTDALTKIDPQAADYFHQQLVTFETVALGPYDSAIDDIKTRFAGVAVGATESIFTPLADALALRVVTPNGYLTAISEGDAPTSGDKLTVDQQVKDRLIKVLVYNEQNATPDVRSVVDQARIEGIPVVGITETPTPANVSFQDWQTRQLQALRAALEQAA